jgi:hypothetical protein
MIARQVGWPLGLGLTLQKVREPPEPRQMRIAVGQGDTEDLGGKPSGVRGTPAVDLAPAERRGAVMAGQNRTMMWCWSRSTV